MDTRRLGQSDLFITPLGVGAWAMGGTGWRMGWGPQDDAESIAAIRRAVERGINWIDTAAVYGLGHSEEVVGRALLGLSSRPYVFTKCGRVAGPDGRPTGNLKPDSIRRECEASLRRLGVEAIDLYQIHWPQPDEEIEDAWTTLKALQSEGKVRWLGASNFDASQLQRVGRIAPVTSLQPPYSLLRREVEAEVLPYAVAHQIGVIVYSPMASGLLSGAMTRERALSLPDNDWRRNHPQFQEPRLSRNLALVEVLREVGARHGVSPGEVAIAWTLRHPAVTGAIVGVRSPAQVDGIVGAAAVRLSDEEAARIEAAIPAD